MEKKGQLNISFGMIFSIILVIAFLAFGFYAISNFISFQDQLVMKRFQENFQADLTKSWKDEVSTREVTYPVLSSVDSVCIVDSRRQTHNVEVYIDGLPTELNFNYIDVFNSTKGRPTPVVCSTPVNDKVKFILEKKYGEPLVIVRVV